MGSVYAKALGVAFALMVLSLFMGAVPAFPAEVEVGIEIAPGAPPPPRHEEIPPPPQGRGDRVEWVPGHWHWDRDRRHWFWTAGHYIERPRHDAHWEPGHWDHRGDGWVWVEGGWH